MRYSERGDENEFDENVPSEIKTEKKNKQTERIFAHHNKTHTYIRRMKGKEHTYTPLK